MTFFSGMTKPVLALASLSGLLLLASCGKFFVDENGTGGSTTTCSNNCLYIGNYNATPSSSDVATFAAVNPLAIVSSTNVTLGDNPTSMAVTPGNSYLYASSSDSGNGSIYVFPLQSGGALGTVTAAISGTGIYIGSIAVDSAGAYLILAGTAVDSTCSTGYVAAVQVYAIGSAGSLDTTPVYSKSISGACLASAGVAANAVAVAPNDKAFFVAFGSVGIASFQFAASTGLPTLQSYVPSPTLTNFNGAVVDSTSTYVFASASGTSGGVYQFKIGSTSALTQVGTVQTGSNVEYPIVVDSSNTYVYTADRGDGEIYGYTFSATGLTAIAGSPFSPSASSTGTLGMVTDSGGKYVITVSETGPNLQEYTIGSDGALATSSTGTTGSLSGSYPVAIAITH
jgi:6-phosphogluconolactonase (cycloisomerase 2 family)